MDDGKVPSAGHGELVRERTEAMITVKEFLKLGFTRWVEAHWTLCSTEEQAREWFKGHGLGGTMYRVPFGWWPPI